jgi:hypothetical protein
MDRQQYSINSFCSHSDQLGMLHRQKIVPLHDNENIVSNRKWSERIIAIAFSLPNVMHRIAGLYAQSSRTLATALIALYIVQANTK